MLHEQKGTNYPPNDSLCVCIASSHEPSRTVGDAEVKDFALLDNYVQSIHQLLHGHSVVVLGGWRQQPVYDWTSTRSYPVQVQDVNLHASFVSYLPNG